VRRSWRGNGVACFWATSLEEIIGGVIAIISFRPSSRSLAARRRRQRKPRPTVWLWLFNQRFSSLHQSSPVFTSLWAAVEVMLCRRNMTSAGGDIADLKNEKHIPMSPKDGMTVEKVSLAMLAVLGVVGLAYFIATALEVLPIISAS